MEAGGGLMGVGSERLATAAKQWPDTETASTAERTRPGVLARRERFGGSFSRPRGRSVGNNESVLTYLLTCYLTHVAHHYRIHTAP